MFNPFMRRLASARRPFLLQRTLDYGEVALPSAGDIAVWPKAIKIWAELFRFSICHHIVRKNFLTVKAEP